MNKPWVTEQLRNLEFRILIDYRRLVYRFKIGVWIPFYTGLIKKKIVFTNVGVWVTCGDYRLCPVEWCSPPFWFRHRFGRRYSGYIIDDYPHPIEADNIAEAIAKYEDQMSKIDECIRQGEKLIAALEQLTQRFDKSHLKG